MNGQIQELVSIFKEIQSISSRLGKEAILTTNRNNEKFRKILSFLYNPYQLTGIKVKKLVKYANFKSENVKQFNDVSEAMDYINNNNTGKDEDVMAIANFINQFNDIYLDEHDFLQELFTKDFKCGITAKTINKAFNEKFIPEFNVMLAKKYENEEHKIKGEFGITTKLDGIRCLAIKENGTMKFFSRQGQPIDGMIELIEDFEHLPDNTVYDGELLLVNKDNLNSDDLFRSTQKVVRKDGNKKDIEFHLFDLLPFEEFINGASTKKYADRMSELHEGLDLTETKFIKKVPMLYWGTDKSKIFELLDTVTSEGKEGLMVSNGNGLYQTKRSDSLLKVKKMETVDLRVLSLEEGNGKYKGKLGNIYVDYKGYKVGVGSGFTDEQRNYYWNNQDEILNNIVEIQYFEESSNQDGGISLRFPVFKRIRDDKTEVSYY